MLWFSLANVNSLISLVRKLWMKLSCASEGKRHIAKWLRWLMTFTVFPLRVKMKEQKCIMSKYFLLSAFHGVWETVSRAAYRLFLWKNKPLCLCGFRIKGKIDIWQFNQIWFFLSHFIVVVVDQLVCLLIFDLFPHSCFLFDWHSIV